MQRLWAGDRLTEDESQINQSSDGLALFLGCNSYVDYEIGRVLDVIKEKLPNAMIIYTSDHGDMLGAHRLFSKNAAIYEEVVKIPLIIKGGERGKVVTAPASHIEYCSRQSWSILNCQLEAAGRKEHAFHKYTIQH